MKTNEIDGKWTILFEPPNKKKTTKICKDER